MARAVLVAMTLAGLVVGCGPSSCTAPASDARDTLDAGPTAPRVGDVGARDGGPIDDPAQAIAVFAAAHGGRHAGPFPVPTGRWLFFVGGDVAHGAWIAAPRPTSAPVFEPVELPRAVRVVDVVVHDATPYVLVESVAALDQPAGLRGVIAVGKENARWTWADARSAAELGPRLGEPRPSLPARWNDTTRFARASKSVAGLSAEIGPAGLTVFEIWQRALVRKVEHVDGASVTTSPRREAIRGLLGRLASEWTTCREESAMCFIGHTGDMSDDEGAHLSADGGAVRIRALFLVSDRASHAAPEAPPSPAVGDALVEAWRFSHDAPAAPRILAQADVGGGRAIGVVHDGKAAWIVERDGAYSRVTHVSGSRDVNGGLRDVGPNPDVRIVDVDGDGIADILVWDTSSKVPRALVYRRSHHIDEEPRRDWLGAEVPMLGATTLEEAERLARAPVVRAQPKNAELCALATRASTARGFRSLAGPGARVVVRSGSFTDGRIERVIAAADVKDEDVASLRCAPDTIASCFVEERLRGLCGIGANETQTVNPMLRLVRVGGAIKIDVASVFGE